MARKFDGSNTDRSSRRTWFYRAKYELEAYGLEGAGSNQIKDITFFERQYYGTISNRDYTVVAKPTTINQITNNHTAMNFVADAFTVMKRRMEFAAKYNKIKLTNPYFVNFQPFKSYQSPTRSYTNFLKSLIVNYNTLEIPDRIGLNNITSFEDYVKYFIKIISVEVQGGVYTMSKWLRSPFCSVFNSGLAIKISDMADGEDQPKINEIIDDSSFDYYLKLALNSGFSISKDSPTTLIFDLASPAAEPFLRKYNLYSLDRIFETNYERSEIYDINILRDILYSYYILFIKQYPYIKENKVNCNKVKSTLTRRKEITLDYFNSVYNEEWFLEHYIDIRNAEEGFPLNEAKVKSLKNISKNYYKTLDRDKSLGYIAKVFLQETWSKPYGYDDFLKNQNQIIDPDAPIPPRGGGTGGY